MDADFIENQRDQLSSRRKARRWSMNSQRLEEIVAVLMRPISSDARRCFDTDLTALLEEYLTEAGLHALDAAEDAPALDAVAPNYAELALLLQQSVTIYSRKVDYLYQQVLEVSESLHTNTLQSPQEEASPAPAARAARRRPSPPRAAAPFSLITDVRDPARGVRERAAPRPHPTLPRMFVELEPRVITGADPPLYDYAGELIGLLDDCQASVDLSHTMMLVDEDFEPGTSSVECALRPISMVELQAAIEAAAPPPFPPATPPPATPLATPPPATPLATPPPATPLATPPATPPASPTASPPPSPVHTSTPLPPAEVEPTVTPDTSGESDLPVVKPARSRSKTNLKRKFNGVIHLEEFFKIIIHEELRQQSIGREAPAEFSLPERWRVRVINFRKLEIQRSREQLRALEPDRESAEFAGWSVAEAATAAAKAKHARVGEFESDDDGFFDQTSSTGDCDGSRADVSDWAAWQAGVLSRAQQAETRGAPDMRALGAAVLRALRPAPAQAPPAPAPAAPVPFAHVLRGTARCDAEVSHVLLATLFLANAGNVDVLAGAPLSLDSFSLQLRSTDERLYRAAAQDDQFLR